MFYVFFLFIFIVITLSVAVCHCAQKAYLPSKDTLFFLSWGSVGQARYNPFRVWLFSNKILSSAKKPERYAKSCAILPSRIRPVSTDQISFSFVRRVELCSEDHDPGMLYVVVIN